MRGSMTKINNSSFLVLKDYLGINFEASLPETEEDRNLFYFLCISVGFRKELSILYIMELLLNLEVKDEK